MSFILQTTLLMTILVVVTAASFWMIDRLQSRLLVKQRLQGGARPVTPRRGASSVVKDDKVRNKVLAWVQASTSLSNDTERRKLSQLLFHAGFISPSAPVLFLLARFILGIGFPILFLISQVTSETPFSTVKMSICAIALCAGGLILPRALVDQRVAARRTQLEQQFPDALDLMVVCVEAGLGMEAAFLRVGQEVIESHPRIAAEFAVLSQELRAGRTRAEALRSLSERTDMPAIRSFAALLIQTDALGTSIGQTLRIYSQEMRQNRLINAEEKAMRIPVLMTIPLVACILPVVMTALLLPPVIDMIRQGIPALTGGH